MTEQAGYLNAPDLVEECARAMAVSVNDAESYHYIKPSKAILSVLRKRGLLTIQALELLDVDR